MSKPYVRRGIMIRLGREKGKFLYQIVAKELQKHPPWKVAERLGLTKAQVVASGCTARKLGFGIRSWKGSVEDEKARAAFLRTLRGGHRYNSAEGKTAAAKRHAKWKRCACGLRGEHICLQGRSTGAGRQWWV